MTSDLKLFRKYYNKTQKEVADSLKISVRSYINYEKGYIYMPLTTQELLKYKLEEWKEEKISKTTEEIKKLELTIEEIKKRDV